MNTDFIFCVFQCLVDHWVIGGTIVGLVGYSLYRVGKAVYIASNAVVNTFRKF